MDLEFVERCKLFYIDVRLKLFILKWNKKNFIRRMLFSDEVFFEAKDFILF
jgi:hypothetical protein